MGVLKKLILVFVIAVLLPSLVLAALAVRGLRDQQYILERQQTLLSQEIAEGLVRDVNNRMLDIQGEFRATVIAMLEDREAGALGEGFPEKISEVYPLAEVGFALDPSGDLVAPPAGISRRAGNFLRSNLLYLEGAESANVFTNALPIIAPPRRDGAGDRPSRQERAQFGEGLDLEVRQVETQPAGNLLRRAYEPSPSQEPPAAEPTSDKTDPQPAPEETSDLPLDESPAELEEAVSLLEPDPFQGATDSSPAVAGEVSSEPRRVIRPKILEDSTTDIDEIAAPPKSPPAEDQSGSELSLSVAESQSETSQAQTKEKQQLKVQLPPLPPGISNRSSFTKASQVRIQQQAVEPEQQVESPEEEPRMRVRRVIPRQNPEEPEGPPAQQISRLRQREADFLKVVGAASDGIVARMREEGLEILVWYRPDDMPSWVYGAKLNMQALRDRLAHEVYVDDDLRAELALALLDQRGEPIALSQPDFSADWRRPFVAAEIGEVLPFWEAAVYQVDPERLRNSAEVLRYSLGALVLLLVGVIGLGSGFIARDLNRQVRAARQKTDFVSNVSHELKTPLTSIRMFSELLSEGRVKDAAKQKNYLEIIVSEASRLTRLINNVLDFANMERGEKTYRLEDVDLVSLIRENVEMLEPSLESHGMRLSMDLPEEPLPIRGDADALAQVVVNLVSNCEKYAAAGKEVAVSLRQQGDLACLAVEDRGPGVPRGLEQKIFEQFFRADESLSSGKQGSGLGLTLARQIVQAHEGNLRYEARRGGGSRFVMELPLQSAPVEPPPQEPAAPVAPTT